VISIDVITYGTQLVKRHDSRQHTVGVFISSAILILFWIAAMIYFKLAITKDKSKAMWDIWTWSCHERSVKGEIPWNILCILQVRTYRGFSKLI
jgi:hypothetical protein